MKKIFTSFLVVCGLTAFSQINNPGFESWTNGMPNDWESSNVEGSVMPVTQSSDAHSGSSAARLGVESAFGFSVPGVVSQMDIPINYLPESMSFWVKSTLDANAQVFGTFAVYDNSDVLIGIGYFNVPGSSSNYSEVYVPTNFTGSTGLASYCSISISLSSTDGSTLALTNYCLVDDISLSSVPLSINENAVLSFSVYPNPCASDLIHVDLSSVQGQVKMDILDLQGKVVLTEKSVGGTNHSLQVGDLSKGVYMVKLYADAEVLTTKLVID